MNDRQADNSRDRQKAGPDPLADLIRGAGRMPEPSAAFAEALREELATAWRAQVMARRARRRRIGAGLAAAFVLAIAAAQLVPTGAGVAGRMLRVAEGLQLVHDGERRQPAVNASVPVGSMVMTGGLPVAMELGGRFNVRLAAHTRVTVNAVDHLLLEDGKLYIDSGADADGLVIDTPLGTVRDIGTQFAVAVERGQLTVQVRDGQVNVQQSSTVVAIKPGQRLHLDERGGVQTERIALSGGEWLWAESVAPVLATEGRSVHDFLEAINRQTGLEIRYASPQLARKAATTIIGGQHPNLPPRQLLDVVISATDFRHAVTDSEVIIHGR